MLQPLLGPQRLAVARLPNILEHKARLLCLSRNVKNKATDGGNSGLKNESNDQIRTLDELRHGARLPANNPHALPPI